MSCEENAIKGFIKTAGAINGISMQSTTDAYMETAAARRTATPAASTEERDQQAEDVQIFAKVMEASGKQLLRPKHMGLNGLPSASSSAGYASTFATLRDKGFITRDQLNAVAEDANNSIPMRIQAKRYAMQAPGTTSNQPPPRSAADAQKVINQLEIQQATLGYSAPTSLQTQIDDLQSGGSAGTPTAQTSNSAKPQPASRKDELVTELQDMYSQRARKWNSVDSREIEKMEAELSKESGGAMSMAPVSDETVKLLARSRDAYAHQAALKGLSADPSISIMQEDTEAALKQIEKSGSNQPNYGTAQATQRKPATTTPTSPKPATQATTAATTPPSSPAKPAVPAPIKHDPEKQAHAQTMINNIRRRVGVSTARSERMGAGTTATDVLNIQHGQDEIAKWKSQLTAAGGTPADDPIDSFDVEASMSAKPAANGGYKDMSSNPYIGSSLKDFLAEDGTGKVLGAAIRQDPQKQAHAQTMIDTLRRRVGVSATRASRMGSATSNADVLNIQHGQDGIAKWKSQLTAAGGTPADDPIDNFTVPTHRP